MIKKYCDDKKNIAIIKRVVIISSIDNGGYQDQF